MVAYFRHHCGNNYVNYEKYFGKVSDNRIAFFLYNIREILRF